MLKKKIFDDKSGKITRALNKNIAGTNWAKWHHDLNEIILAWKCKSLQTCNL